MQFVDGSGEEAEGARATILRSYRQRGYLAEKEAASLVTFCNVSLFDLVQRRVLPILGLQHVSAMRHELEVQGVPVDYGVLIDCPTRPIQPWSHLQQNRYRDKQVFWKRGVPEESVKYEVVEVYTLAVRLFWADEEVVYPYPLYGYLTGVGQDVGDILRQAVYARYLDETFTFV
jgi:hypothetical protein